MQLRTLFVGLILLTASALAADVDGKWSGSVNTPNGDITITYNFKADGAKLTGNMVGMDGNNIAVADGKIDGNKIAFSVTLDFGGMPFKIDYTGVVSASEIKLTSEFGGMPFEFTVKKST